MVVHSNQFRSFQPVGAEVLEYVSFDGVIASVRLAFSWQAMMRGEQGRGRGKGSRGQGRGKGAGVGK